MSHEQLPLSALLSQVLVAFTIEVDNEADHRLPHRTTDFGSTTDPPSGPWLVSVAMYFNCMKYVPDEGITIRELGRLARTDTNLGGMLRWGYMKAEPDPKLEGAKKPGPDSVLRPTRWGRRARDIWQDLVPEIESRWKARFGNAEIEVLLGSLRDTEAKLSLDLPDCLPILGYGLYSKRKFGHRESGEPRVGDGFLPRLSRILLTYAIQYESRSEVSLAIAANVLRVLDDGGVRVRDLPLLSGVSKESIAMAVGFLKGNGFASMEPAPAPAKGEVVRLTPKGAEARTRYFSLTSAIDEQWPSHFGEETTRQLRSSLSALVGDGTPESSPLFRCLKPYPEGWRSKVRTPSRLPHFPMVLHRGGYPDGS